MKDTAALVARRRVEAQGFVNLDDRTLAQIRYWLRLAPAACMAWAAIGTLAGSATILWALVPFAALGGLLNGHPFDVVYNHGIRRLTGGPRLPPYPGPRRFACLLATVMLVGAAGSFQSGHPGAGYALGGALVGAALVNVTTGFCIPSFLYGLVFGGPASCTVASRTDGEQN